MDNNQSATLPDAPQLSVAVGGDNVSEETTELHVLINKEFGTKYADDDAALKGLKETRDYVGRAGQMLKLIDSGRSKGMSENEIILKMQDSINGNAQASPVSSDTDKFATKEQVAKLQADIFYRDNPNVATYRQAIDEFAAATRKTQAEVIQMDAFKSLIDNAKGFDEVQKAKSVLQTNPRLGVASDNLTKAQESAKAGDIAGAQAHAMDAVMEIAYGKK